MHRTFAVLIALSLVACGSSEEEKQPDAGTQQDAGGSSGTFSFYMNACRAHPSEVVGTRVEVAGGQDLLNTKDSPEDPAPWCQRLSDADFEVSDAREGVSGSATFDLKIYGNEVTVAGTAQASGSGPAVTANSGFTLLDLRAGGGGVERVRVTVTCSGSASGTAAGASIELANGEIVCSTAALDGTVYPFEQTTATFEESTSSPDSVVVALRINVSALGGDDGASSSAQGSFVIVVEPL
jgi:hypothetical protein